MPSTNYDYAVIGAGIAGASLAFELAQAGTVALLEMEPHPGYHATGRSAALFAPTYGGAVIRALTRASAAFFHSPPESLVDVALLRERGCLYIARADQMGALDLMAARIRESGGTVLVETALEAAKRVPLLNLDYVAGAIFDENAFDVDVDALHQGFLRGAKASGVMLVTGSPLKFAARSGGEWKIDCGDLKLCASVIVNAAGAWADDVAERCGVSPVGLTALRRTALLVPAATANVATWPAVLDVDEQFYFKPDAGNLLISPADEVPVVPADVYPDDIDVATGIDRVQDALSIEVRRVLHSWAGLRTFAADRNPVVGFDPAKDGFFWCAGQGGYGVQTAPALSRLAAALVLGRGLPADIELEGVDPAAMSPSRFGIAKISDDVG